MNDDLPLWYLIALAVAFSVNCFLLFLVAEGDEVE